MSYEIKTSPEELARLTRKRQCEKSHLQFSRYFFKKRQGSSFLTNWHHLVICDSIERVITGEFENLVINVPPGSSKTELAVINLISRGLALNPWSRFLHISCGDDLVLLNSQTARDIVLSEEYQQLWPREIASDAKSKRRWNVMVDGKKAGGLYAVSLGGQIIGFRAGYMIPGFSGAIIIDDPLKADDAYSAAAIKNANRALLSTVKSRKAHPKVPIILIMQRIRENDCTGFIKSGNVPGKWSFVNIPALITDEYVANLPENIRAMVNSEIRDDKGRFSYWPYKEPLQDMLALEAGAGKDQDGNVISKFVFHSQYQQEPKTMGGNIIKGSWFSRVAMPPKIKYRKIFADTAQKTKERNDYSVAECWGLGDDGKIYLLDLLRGKWEAPELRKIIPEFWWKNAAIKDLGVLREMIVEDKSSGIGLIQEIQRADRIPVRGVKRDRDKYQRVMGVASFIEAGYVCLIDGKPFNSDFVNECELFTADDTHMHDDQIDPLVDAITDMLSTRPKGFFSL